MHLLALTSVPNLDIVLMGLVAVSIGTLGVVVFFNNPKSATNQSFFIAAITVVLWGVLNLAVFRATTPAAALWLLRFAVFAALWHAYFAFRLFFVFPRTEYAFPIWERFVVAPFVGMVSILTLTPYVFDHVQSFGGPGLFSIANGLAIPLFGVSVVGLHAWGLFIFSRNTFRVRGQERTPYLYILTGAAVTYTLILVLNYVFPAILGNSVFAPYAGLFTFPYIILTAYAVIKNRLMNVRVVATEIFVALLAVTTLFEVLLVTGLYATLFQAAIFVLTLALSYLLVRTEIREAQQRERIELLAAELQATNARQEGLIHFIGHEVKGFLTKAEGAFSVLAEGDMGDLQPQTKEFVERALKETRDGVTSVSDILHASNLKKGTTAYTMEPFDLGIVVTRIAEGARAAANAKGLTLTLEKAEGTYRVKGDEREIGEHVLRNLVDNAVNYTPSGSVVVQLSRDADTVSVSVTDTGIGISAEDKAHLFTEGGHGKDSIKTNVHSTGYGLFIAKTIMDAHRGTITAKSEGLGKGSTFVMTLPAAN